MDIRFPDNGRFNNISLTTGRVPLGCQDDVEAEKVGPALRRFVQKARTLSERVLNTKRYNFAFKKLENANS